MKIELNKDLPVFVIREARMPGAWGKGRTPTDAAVAIRKHGARNGCTVYAFAASEDACFNDMGDGCYSARGPIYKGALHNTGVKIASVHDAAPLPSVEG